MIGDPVSTARDEGLRARKRAATTAAIERAALELAAAHGYEHVTVDMICDAAMVSPRTFFNYFGSKEGVILGASPPEPSAAERDAFVNSRGGDVLGELVAMLTSAMEEQDPDPAVFKARRSIISEHPGLLLKQIDRIAEQESKLVGLVMERFDRQGRSTSRTPDLEDEARIVVALVGSVMRFTIREWFDDRSTASPAELLAKAVRLIHRVTRAE